MATCRRCVLPALTSLRAYSVILRDTVSVLRKPKGFKAYGYSQEPMNARRCSWVYIEPRPVGHSTFFGDSKDRGYVVDI